MKKQLALLTAITLLLAACGKEEQIAPVDTNNIQQEPQTVHFDLKESSPSTFNVNREEPEGVTGEMKEMFGVSDGQEVVEIGKSEEPVATTDLESEMATQGSGPETNTTGAGMNGIPNGSDVSTSSGGVTTDAASSLQEKMDAILAQKGARTSADIEEAVTGVKATEPVEEMSYPESTYKWSNATATQLNPEIKQWVETKKKTQGAFEKVQGGLKYLLIATGEKNTNGFKVTVGGVYEKPDAIEVYFEVEELQTAMSISSHPYILIAIPMTNKKINAYGDF